MGGEAGVDSRPGEGSTFWAELPLAPAMLQGDCSRARPSDNERLQDARVLLVEDNPVNMMIAAATLAQWGVEVAEARDGRMAIDAVRDAARARPALRSRPDGRADAGDERPRGRHRAAQGLERAAPCRSSR